ncbi:MAG: recombination protein RecR [Gemmatimonadaceae bacterium]|nr:recombination protein RecR [Gemmatimonadaceae bacterium]NUQ91613.1 recombination protein RecR [Gemmatimonadaceae bacterium]NUS99186.1 recombination protein RecR [Gemmatimonadaceae bacterium]
MSAIDDLATELSRLPGIGRKTALRLTYHLLKQSSDQTRRLAEALLVLGERVHPCARCYNLTEQELCDICRDPRRDVALICAVEEASDIGAIERAGEFRGTYHVLGGRISPLDGVGPEDLRIGELVERARGGVVREVIVATNPSLEGEATALYVQRQLAPLSVTVSRIARGLPVGGDLEYADGVTIAQALSARREMR